ncbi:cytochrome P450 [Crocosphaera subtropica ATCC 51142]|uniref:Cytochrome P450 n=1 Tax=Crocosphaera subtropica (strain ATCC 51142 / BH68) TaxID=43989 RepID=B1WQC4_CROS5|nr:cytochrome P450 [Crocosphaera subtropica]ACB50046.1 cytochrome P450 [Crocosphaera subtropica ATCC 51142]
MTSTVTHTSTPNYSYPSGFKTYGIKNSLRLIFQPLQVLEENRNDYGDIYFSPEFGGFPPFIIIGNSQGVEALFNINPDLLDTSSSNALLKPLLGDRSLIQLDGDQHQKRRKLLMPSFHGQRLQSYGNIITDITQNILNHWSKSQTFPMRKITQEISLKVILRAVFGLNLGERYQDLGRSFTDFLDLFNSPLHTMTLFYPSLQKDWGKWTPWGQFQAYKRDVYHRLEQEIRQHQQGSDSEDILSLLLSTVDEEGNHLSQEEIMDELVTLLFAGHETTASTLAWAFYWIHSQPEVYQNLMAELDSININSDPMMIAKLPYLSAVVSESLRIYPSVLFTFGRKLKTDLHFLDYYLPKETAIIPCIYLLHHHLDIYPNSKQFQPERFLERQFSPYEFIPFGGSNRRCLGYALALYEMKLVLATVLKQVKLALVNNKEILPIRRGFTMSPAGGVKMRVIQHY